MEAAHNLWLSRIHSPANEIIELLAAMSAVSLPYPSPFKHSERIWNLYNKLQVICSTAPPEIQLRHLCTQSEFAPFITKYTTLVKALILQLDRLGSRLSSVPSSIGTATEEVFWELWRILVAVETVIGYAYGRRSSLFEKQPFCAGLYDALNMLLQWLLSISRSPAWVAMQRQHGLVDRNGELLAILAQPLDCLLRFSTNIYRSIFCSHLSCFPPTMLPLLCCIMSEQFTNAPVLVPLVQPAASSKAALYKGGVGQLYLAENLDQFLHAMLMVINNFATRHISTEFGSMISFVAAPAVFHFLKAVLILPRKASSPPTVVSLCMGVLDSLSSFSNEEALTNPSPLLSAPNASLNKDALGLPLHTNPRFSNLALETDARLLHALVLHQSADASLTQKCCEMQVVILRSWMTDRLLPISSETLTVMVRSVVGLAKTYSLQGLRMMQQVQKLGVEDTFELDLKKKLRLHAHKALSSSHNKESAVPSLEAMNAVRTVMHNISDFAVTLPNFQFHTATGEWTC